MKPTSKKVPLFNARVSKVILILIVASLVSNESSHLNLMPQRRYHSALSNEAARPTVERKHISSSSNTLTSSSSYLFKRGTSSRDHENPSMLERVHFFKCNVDAVNTLDPLSKRHVHGVSNIRKYFLKKGSFRRLVPNVLRMLLPENMKVF